MSCSRHFERLSRKALRFFSASDEDVQMFPFSRFTSTVAIVSPSISLSCVALNSRHSTCAARVTFGGVCSNKALQATAAPPFTFDVSWFIVHFICAQALPSAAVPELGRWAKNNMTRTNPHLWDDRGRTDRPIRSAFYPQPVQPFAPACPAWMSCHTYLVSSNSRSIIRDISPAIDGLFYNVLQQLVL